MAVFAVRGNGWNLAVNNGGTFFALLETVGDLLRVTISHWILFKAVDRKDLVAVYSVCTGTRLLKQSADADADAGDNSTVLYSGVD